MCVCGYGTPLCGELLYYSPLTPPRLRITGCYFQTVCTQKHVKSQPEAVVDVTCEQNTRARMSRVVTGHAPSTRQYLTIA